MTLSPPFPSHDRGNGAAGLVIRPAGLSDLGAIAGLENASFTSDRLTRRSIRALIVSPSAQLLVAERASAVVGYALVLVRRGSRLARLYSIAVAAGEAGRGTGRRLVEAAEREASDAGMRALRLEVRIDNKRAIALYDDLGYRGIGERPHYYEDGMTALRYEKSLNSGTDVRRPRAGANRSPVPAERSA